MKSYKILSIDAWLDECSCPYCGSNKIKEEKNFASCLFCQEKFSIDQLVQSWFWNSWHTVGKFSGPLTDDALTTFKNDFFKNPDLVSYKDDGYNIIFFDKKSNEPLYAIEYGSEE